MNSYIIRSNENIFSVYNENNCIYQRERTASGWGEPNIIASNIGKSFSLIHSTTGEPLILCQDKAGNLILAGSGKPHKTVLRNTSGIIKNPHIYGYINSSTMRIFYNRDYIKDSCLTEQHRREDGSWSSPAVIDCCISEEKMTKLINIEKNYILFYLKKVPEQQIGYREIGTHTIGEFKLLYSTGYKISDYSLAVTEEEIHMAAVINTNRLSRLIYVKKNSNGISKAIMLYEGLINLCHISIQSSKITIFFSTHKGNSKVTSFDMGASFKRIEAAQPFSFTKSVFVDYTKQIPDNFVACELLTDTVYPYNVKMCPFITETSENEIERLKKEIERLREAIIN